MIPTNLQDFYSELGTRIRKARMDSQINQDVLAQQLGLTRASIVNIEKGRQRPMVHTLIEIAAILNVNFTSLIPGIYKELILHPHEQQPMVIETDFENIISDELNIDPSTKDAVKQFVSHLKK